MSRACLTGSIAALAIALVGAAGPARGEPPAEAPVVIELFTRAGCPRCADARSFLTELAGRHPAVRVVTREVDADPLARERLHQLAAQAGVASPAVPAFHLRGRLLVGYSAAAGSRERLEALVRGDAADAAELEGGATCALDEPCEPAADQVRLPLVGVIEAHRLGLPLFTLVIGLVDGFNPCATWVLLFLLAMLVNVRSRRKVIVVGGVFVAASGAVYFAFMAAWLTVFMVLGVSRLVAAILGLVALIVGAFNLKDAVTPGKGFSFSIPQPAKPGIYARVRRILAADSLAAAATAAAVLAFLVNLVELLCTAGLPAVYTAVLTAQDLPVWQYHGYLLLYVAAYMLDDAILLAVAVVTLRKFKLQERGGRLLKLVSGAVMLALGGLLLLRPGWLGW